MNISWIMSIFNRTVMGNLFIIDKMTRMSYHNDARVIFAQLGKRGSHMDTKSSAKRQLILTNAKNVFIRKGFASVTMKDIIQECGISRGGIYLYFQSVEEIFMHVIKLHNRQKAKEARQHISEDRNFSEMIDQYLEKQKTRLMNLENSLLIAMYEYRFANRDIKHKEFFHDQFVYTKNIISDILNFGCVDKDVDALASSIVLLIEGISMLAIAVGVTEEFIDMQMDVIRGMIFDGYKSSEGLVKP